MNGNEKTFKDRFLAGECTFEKIDAYVEQWHTGAGGGQSLREYLGMTKEEYAYMLRHSNEETARYLTRRCSLRNACMGGYGNCIDVKITNRCNAHCAFCIEHGGYSPAERPVQELIQSTNALRDYPTVLVLGGEPLLYPYLEGYLRGIRPHKEKIYLTTNGIALDAVMAQMLSQYLDGINVSLHHYQRKRLLQMMGNAPAFPQLREAFAVFAKNEVPVRINCNLVKDGVSTHTDALHMIGCAQKLGATSIRFSELQNAEEWWVDARTVFHGLTDHPFVEGCVQELPEFSFPVSVKMTCGAVNRHKRPVVQTEAPRAGTKVVYPDASVKNGWVSGRSANCHRGGCHPYTRG